MSNANIRIVDENGKAVKPATPIVEASALSDAQIASVRGMTGNAYRQSKGALSLATGKTLREIDEMTMDNVAAMLDAAAIAEGVELAPIDLAPDTGDTIFGAAVANLRAPVVERMIAIYAGRIEQTDADDAAKSKPMVAIAYADTAAPVMIRLQYPIKVNGEAVATIEVLPPTFGAIQAVGTGAISQADMIAAMTGLPVEAIIGLRIPDAERLISIALEMAPNVGAI